MKVLYIGGAGRSGSTLLEIILGNAPGFVSVGEIRFWWEYVQQGGIRCGCGELLLQCVFWRAVHEKLLQDNPRLDIAQIADLARKLDRSHNLPRYGRGLSADNPQMAALIKATGQLYEAVWQVGGQQIIVDSSKVPSHLWLLEQVPALDLRLLHLVRDGRAVAYSWNKRHKKELAAIDGDAHMARHSNLRALFVWALENSYITRFGSQLSYATQLRYEDFAAAPGPSLSQALTDLGWPDTDLSLLQTEPLFPEATHSVGGNPLRFQRHGLTIAPDSEWQQQMSLTSQRLLGLLFAPLFNRYHYAIW